jgi:ribosomal protein S18 acetylase RimI-like enzyme
MQIKRADFQDIPVLVALDHRAVGKTLSSARPEALWQNELVHDIVLMVAETDGTAIASIVLKQFGATIELSDFLVDPDYQDDIRRRVGTKLLESALAVADTIRGVQRQRLLVNPDNTRAIHLYEKFGFKARSIPLNPMAEWVRMERRPFAHIFTPADARPYTP